MKTKYTFEVERLESGQRGSYQDSYYRYEVVSELSEYIVKRFCMNVLQPSYERKNMPNPFAGELLEFKKIDDNKYYYSTKSLYTG